MACLWQHKTAAVALTSASGAAHKSCMDTVCAVAAIRAVVTVHAVVAARRLLPAGGVATAGKVQAGVACKEPSGLQRKATHLRKQERCKRCRGMVTHNSGKRFAAFARRPDDACADALHTQLPMAGCPCGPFCPLPSPDIPPLGCTPSLTSTGMMGKSSGRTTWVTPKLYHTTGSAPSRLASWGRVGVKRVLLREGMGR